VSGAGAKKGGGRSQSGYNGYAPPGYTNANGYNAQINGGWAGAYGGAGWAAPPPFGGFGTAPGFLPFGLNAAVSPAAGGIGAFGNQANPQAVKFDYNTDPLHIEFSMRERALCCSLHVQVLSLQQQQNAIASLYNLNALGHGATTQSFLQNHSAPAVVSGKPVDGEPFERFHLRGFVVVAKPFSSPHVLFKIDSSTQVQLTGQHTQLPMGGHTTTIQKLESLHGRNLRPWVVTVFDVEG
jgi:hypothetical protein